MRRGGGVSPSFLDEQRFEDATLRGAEGDRLSGRAIDVDMNEIAFGRRRVLLVAEQADLIANGGTPEPGHANAGGDLIRESHFREIPAPSFDDKEDLFALMNIQNAIFNQMPINCRIEKTIMNDIIHVTV